MCLSLQMKMSIDFNDTEDKRQKEYRKVNIHKQTNAF